MVSDNPPPSKGERSEETSRIDSAPSVVPQLGEEGVSKADFVLETGLLPSEYLLQTLEESGRKLLQQEMVKLSGWSESRISAILTEMEEQEHIVRIQLGRENVVYLPILFPTQMLTPQMTAVQADQLPFKLRSDCSIVDSKGLAEVETAAPNG